MANTNTELSIGTVQPSSVTELENTPQKAINNLLKQDLTKLINTDLWGLLLEKRPSSGCHVNSSNYFSVFSGSPLRPEPQKPLHSVPMLHESSGKENKTKKPTPHMKESNFFNMGKRCQVCLSVPYA